MPEPGRDPGPVGGFYKEDAARIGAVVRRIEAEVLNPGSNGARQRAAVPSRLIPAKTKSAGITAGSQTTPSTNSVTLLVPSGTGDGLTAGTDVNILNYSTRAIAGAGKMIWLGFFNGKMCLPMGDC